MLYQKEESWQLKSKDEQQEKTSKQLPGRQSENRLLKNSRKRPALLLVNKQQRLPGRADDGAANGFFFHARSFSHERLEEEVGRQVDTDRNEG
jgi:hypothetical protein